MTEHKWKEGERVLVVRSQVGAPTTYRTDAVEKVHKTGRFVLMGHDRQFRACGQPAGRPDGYTRVSIRVEPYSDARHVELARQSVMLGIRSKATAAIYNVRFPTSDKPADLLDEIDKRRARLEQLADAIRAANEATTPDALAEIYEGLSE